MRIVVASTGADIHSSYDENIQGGNIYYERTAAFETRTDSFSVSSVTGNHRIRIHAVGGKLPTRTCSLTVYEVYGTP